MSGLKALQNMTPESLGPIVNAVIAAFGGAGAKGPKMDIQCIPGHNGIRRNEEADRTAHDAHHTRPCHKAYRTPSDAKSMVYSVEVKLVQLANWGNAKFGVCSANKYGAPS